MTYLRVLYTRFHLNSFTLRLITQLHGDASFAHSSGVVFMKSFHKRLTPSAVLSVCSNFTTCSVNAFLYSYALYHVLIFNTIG